jgi:hypothetical protein
MKSRAGWIAVAIAVAAVAAVAAAAIGLWGSVGASDISLGGWLALAFGIIVTLALGIGLMGLVFISSRRGYDEPGRRER